MLKFQVIESRYQLPKQAPLSAFLIKDNWDDWFKFETLFELVVFDTRGEKHDIGGVKIGEFGLDSKKRKPAIPESFDQLSNTFFSLGQDDSYYESLNQLHSSIRDDILESLRDVAANTDLFEEARNEDVMQNSLLRFVSQKSVTGQFHRIAHGGVRLTRYSFNYTGAKPIDGDSQPIVIDFKVQPESTPPTNIHVIIGRNGVGKTRLLYHMITALTVNNANIESFGEFQTGDDDEQIFANIVSVAFSAFDSIDPPTTKQTQNSKYDYHYVGLKRTESEGGTRATKSQEMLSTEFANSVTNCMQGAKKFRWLKAITTLEADPIIEETEIFQIAQIDHEQEVRKTAYNLFSRLSSGHKIVLLTLTRLIEQVEEKTLVLLDEPEAHLHPPLLSAFIRALSDLLIDRNGVAIVATHSPVVLQEVPQSCVWKLRRTGVVATAERSEFETFGENVGVLTREVFGLEVTKSGFHSLIYDQVQKHPNYDTILSVFGGEIGGEAKALVQALVAIKLRSD